jgi:hypothetical protein
MASMAGMSAGTAGDIFIRILNNIVSCRMQDQLYITCFILCEDNLRRQLLSDGLQSFARFFVL